MSTQPVNPRAVSAIDRHIGEIIRARRLELSMSQESLADAIGVTFQQVQKYERGFNRVSAATLFRICKVLDVRVATFLPRAKGARPADGGDMLDELAEILAQLNGEQRQTLMAFARDLAPSSRRRAK